MTFFHIAAHTSPRRAHLVRTSAAVAAATAALVAGAGSAVAAPAPAVPALPQLSSAPQLSSSLPQIELPKEAYALADQYNIALPDFVKKPAQPQVSAELAAQLDGATTAHLNKQGHTENAAAGAIAQEWADQAARGEVAFVDNAGDGSTHLNEGTGNIYRLNSQQAQDRLNWLNRAVPVQTSPEKHGFGVATSRSGEFVYVAEFFLN